MARFFDKVGFIPTGTFVDGVWSGNSTERAYKGTVLEATSSLEPSDKVNDDFRLQDRIVIMADSFAIEHCADIRYVFRKGIRWTVQSVREERPELTLNLGGVYDGPIPD